MSTPPSLRETNEKEFKVGIADVVFVGMILIGVIGLTYVWLSH